MIRLAVGSIIVIPLIALVASCGSEGDASGGPTAHESSSAPGVALRGRVVMAPLTPNEPAGPSQATSPVVGATVTVSVGSKTVRTTTTDSEGRFSVQVPPGRYVVTAGARGPSATAQVEVRDRPVTVLLQVDTGIR